MIYIYMYIHIYTHEYTGRWVDRPRSNQAAPKCTVHLIKLETGLRPNSAGIPYLLLLKIEAIGFPTFWLLLYRFLLSGLRFSV